MGNKNVIQISGLSDIQDLQESAEKDFFIVSEKFKSQLQGLFQEDTEPETDKRIQERAAKASVWFQDKFSKVFSDLVEKLYVETDNKELGKRINIGLENLKQEIKVKLAGVKSCKKGFVLVDYLHGVSTAKVDLSSKKIKKPKAPVYSESDIDHPELFQELKEWRTDKAKQDGVPAFFIMHQKVLVQIVINLPQNADELEKLPGMGPKTIEKYGEDILDMVVEYRKQHKITKVILPEPADIPEKKVSGKKSQPGLDTKKISFDMFNDGLSMAQIAAKRELAESTIEGHLGFFVEQGELDIDKLVSPEKQKTIKKTLVQNHVNPLRTVKDKLGSKDNYSYGDIKLVISYLKYLALKQKS
jgi:hypothetical protein